MHLNKGKCVFRRRHHHLASGPASHPRRVVVASAFFTDAMPDPFKRRRVDGTPGGNAAGAALLVAKELPAASANVIAQLVSLDGTPTGPQLDLPSDVTPGQLGELLNGLLRHEERTPYAFYCAGSELHAELGPHLHKANASVEGVLQITYQARGRFLVGWQGRRAPPSEAFFGCAAPAAAAHKRRLHVACAFS